MSLRDFPGPGDEVKVSEGPRRNQAGVVVRVLRFPMYQIGANLAIVQAAKKGGER